MPPILTESNLLRRRQVAAMLDISPTTLYRWVLEGVFPDYDIKHGTRYRRYRPATVEKWLAAKAAEQQRLERLAELCRSRRAERRKGGR